MNTIRLIPLYCLLAASLATLNIVLLFDAYDVLWVAGPVLMLAGLVVSVPLFGRIVRWVWSGDMPTLEVTRWVRALNIINLFLFATFFAIFFLKRLV